MSVHDGHRQRLRARFLKEGLDNFEQINALELLLFYCIPRKDTNELAHTLLDHFGSFHQVMDATPEELMAVPGIGEGAATFLPLISAACRYYRVSQVKNVCALDTIEKCGDYLVNFFHARKNETVFLLCLDAKCKVIVCREIGEGSVNSASVSARKVTEIALGVNATSVILAHNHPSGVALPSSDDVATTKLIARSLGAVGITLMDHIVIAEDDYVSMAMSGLYNVDDIVI
ncbi:MAG: DNA repair protein RadC [Ruminococcaceae bacterium]|nr:DNA repair protein RadC [Oscillospiraceae bacterium]